MNILINALSAKGGGANTYLVNFLKNIPNGYPHNLTFLCGSYNVNEFRKFKPSCVKLEIMNIFWKNSVFRTIWEIFILPIFIKIKNIDIYFQPAAGVPISIPKKCKSVTMLRNMLPFEDRERKRYPLFSLIRFKMFLQKHNILKSINLANKVIFISQYSQNIVSSFLPNIKKRSIVIPHGLDEQFINCERNFDISQLGLESNKFYLYVSSLDYYKAQFELIREWKILIENDFKYPLVLAGALNRTSYVEKVKKEIKALGIEDMVILTGKIAHEDLPAFYRHARALVFASSCECCPNILLEKMAAGRPLFVSNIPPMPEFGGESAYYFNPYSTGDLSKVIMNAEKSYETMIIHGNRIRVEASKYRWQTTINKTLLYITDM